MVSCQSLIATRIEKVVNNRTVNEVRTLYGLRDASIPTARADEIVHSVFKLFQKPIDESILKEEFIALLESGGDLPDCEFDGHHGDEEWEVSSFPLTYLYLNFHFHRMLTIV